MNDAIQSGFRELLNFSGRTSRGQFWPYCGTIVALAFITNMAVFAVVIGGGLASDDTNVFPDFNRLIGGIMIWGSAAILLLAAAVTRRLHDTGKSGWWGLLPLPFLFTGFVLMLSFMSQFMESEEPDMSGFFVIFGNNIVYLVALGFLVYLLARPSEPQENRFGPPLE